MNLNVDINKKELRAFFEFAKKHGIYFYIGRIAGGCMDVTPDQAVQYIENSYKFYADLYGITVETVKLFEAHLKDPYCTAITTKNKRCKNRSIDNFELKAFKYGETTLCERHRKDFLFTKNV